MMLLDREKEWRVDYAKSRRSKCQTCKNYIGEELLRLGQIAPSQYFDGSVTEWYHATCFMEKANEIESIDEVEGIESLRWEDQQTIRTFFNGRVSNKSLPFSDHIDAGVNSELKAQSEALWDLKDNLKKHLSVGELRKMLDANDQSTSGSELVLRDRCADRMMFGALKRCQVCSGHLDYSGSTYKCSGDFTEWTRCSFSSSHPERIEGNWKIPTQTDNHWLLEWFNSQKGVKPIRLLPAPSSNVNSGKQTSYGCQKSSKDENIGDLRVLMDGLPKKTAEDFRRKIEGAGGRVHSAVKKDTNCMVVAGELSSKQNAKVEKARKRNIPIVREAYLVDCIERQKKLPFHPYRIEAFGEFFSTVNGNNAVYEDSKLPDSGQILEDGNIYYSTALSKCDLSSDVNSYYILQIIKDNNGPDCYVFRKWGRISNEKIGRSHSKKMSKQAAVENFKMLFKKKTGNLWETWVHKQEFKKRHRKFFPLDLDYGVSKQDQKGNVDDGYNKLTLALEEFFNRLSNVETYRAVNPESKVNFSEMPLGKLTRSHLQKGYKALFFLKYSLEYTALQPFVGSLIVDVSNRLFTMIPSTHSHVIRDEDDLNLKMKWVEALMDNDTAPTRADCRLQPQEPRNGPLIWKRFDEILKDPSQPRDGIAGSSFQAIASQNICNGGRQYVNGMRIGDGNVFLSGNFILFSSSHSTIAL